MMLWQLLKIIVILTTAALLIACDTQHEGQAGDIMYFILIDRFMDGDTTNNAGNNPESYRPYQGIDKESLKYYQGGDLVGITRSLDSLKTLGVTMIWISPFIDNSDTDYVGWWSYHGYHPIDFYKVDEHYGSLKDLKILVDSAHRLGLKVIFDMPFNQTAADHPWIGDESKKNWYHWDENGEPYEITDWFDQEQIERGELHGLPDLAQENPEVSDYLFEVSKYWIDETHCDGFRLDAVKHIPLSFWEDFNKRIKDYAGADFLLLGEVFWGDAQRIKPYLGAGFDILFDLPGYYAIRNTFNKGGSIKDFSDFYQAGSDALGAVPLATIIDNHDVARFNVGLAENAWAKQLLALGWIMTTPGLPVIYAGTELGMSGYPPISPSGEPQDFLNRLPYPAQLSKIERERISQFKSLTQLRQLNPVLGSGSFHEIYKDWSVYAYLRSDGDDHVLLILNNASTEEFLSIPLPGSLKIEEPERIYGTAVLREESNEYFFRLSPNSLSAWRIGGPLDGDLTVRVAFTDRLSRDYRIVRLFYIDPASRIERLQVAGDFNNWVPGENPNQRHDDTIFVDLPLKSGTYEYKLILNSREWIADPNAGAYSMDPYGGQNSILTVSVP
ncbi:MAG: hypothetical protein K9N35_08425 [Candidatus Marinimicrobia bacterium]|nr:hypothetical protein [Candidatus Neomarinimicrobiota bacterium]